MHSAFAGNLELEGARELDGSAEPESVAISRSKDAPT